MGSFFSEKRGIVCDGTCAICTQSSLDCDGNFKELTRKPAYRFSVNTFKPYYDVTMGREVTSKHEIDEYCKRNDMVYAGDKELTQQCEQNKRENALKQDAAFISGLQEKLGQVL